MTIVMFSYARVVTLVLSATMLPECTPQEGSTSTPTTTTTTPGWIAPLEWRKEQVPNPRRDVWRCGFQGQRSWICNPNQLLTLDEALGIDTSIKNLRQATAPCRCDKSSKCPVSESYGGWQAAVAVLKKLSVRGQPSREKLIDASEDFADYLRDDSWEFGVCDDDLVIILSVDDRVVYTKTGDTMSKILTDSCVTTITKEISGQYFKNNSWSEGLNSMISQFSVALLEQHACNQDNGISPVALAVVCVFLILFVGIIVTFFLCRFSGRSSSTGNYSPGENASNNHDSHSNASHSSGGGGDTF